MELVMRPGDPQYRLIIRDEKTKKSKSFGIYNSLYDLDAILLMVKRMMEEEQNFERVEDGI